MSGYILKEKSDVGKPNSEDSGPKGPSGVLFSGLGPLPVVGRLLESLLVNQEKKRSILLSNPEGSTVWE